MAFFYSPNIITDGLVFAVDAADRNSYISGSTTWKDLAGNNNGTLVNGPTFDEANGGSLVFDGSDDYVDTGGEIVDLDNSFTFSSWVKTPNILSENTGYPRLVGRGDNRGSYTGKWASLSYDNQGDSFVVAIDDNVTKSEYFGSILLNPNTWYYAVMVVDRGNDLYLYVNTTLDGSTPDNTSLNVNPPYNLYLGAQRSNNSPAYLLKGNISQTHIYNRALTPSEITQNYNALKSRFGL